MFGFINKIVKPVSNVLGVGTYDPNREDFQNPYLARDRQFTTKNAGMFSNQARDAFRDMGKQQGIINRGAAGYNPLISHLVQMENGQGPSLAGMQLQEGADRNIENQMALAGSNQNINPAMAQRLMAGNISDINQQLSGDAAQLRLQEQMDAISQQIAARQAQGNMYGMAGDLMSNRASTAGNLGANYQGLAQNLADQERNAMIDYHRIKSGAFDTGQARRGEFWSKIAQSAAMGGK